MGKSKSKRTGNIASCDLFFGHPLRVNYAGQENYGTVCGAIMTFLILIIMLAFVVLSFKLIIFRYYGISLSSTGLQDSVISTV